MKLFAVFDTCREPIEITRKIVIDFHNKVAAEKLGDNYIPVEENRASESKENEPKGMPSNAKFNYYVIYGTTSGSLVKAAS